MRVHHLLLPFLFAAACMSAPQPAQQQSNSVVEEGRFLAQVHCSECHAIGVSDRSSHAEAIPFRRLSELYPVAAIEESLAEGIMVGHPDMPEFRFRGEDAAALIAYLESIQQAR